VNNYMQKETSRMRNDIKKKAPEGIKKNNNVHFYDDNLNESEPYLILNEKEDVRKKEVKKEFVISNEEFVVHNEERKSFVVPNEERKESVGFVGLRNEKYEVYEVDDKLEDGVLAKNFLLHEKFNLLSENTGMMKEVKQEFVVHNEERKGFVVPNEERKEFVDLRSEMNMKGTRDISGFIEDKFTYLEMPQSQYIPRQSFCTPRYDYAMPLQDPRMYDDYNNYPVEGQFIRQNRRDLRFTRQNGEGVYPELHSEPRNYYYPIPPLGDREIDRFKVIDPPNPYAESYYDTHYGPQPYLDQSYYYYNPRNMPFDYFYY